MDPENTVGQDTYVRLSQLKNKKTRLSTAMEKPTHPNCRPIKEYATSMWKFAEDGGLYTDKLFHDWLFSQLEGKFGLDSTVFGTRDKYAAQVYTFYVCHTTNLSCVKTPEDFTFVYTYCGESWCGVEPRCGAAWDVNSRRHHQGLRLQAIRIKYACVAASKAVLNAYNRTYAPKCATCGSSVKSTF